MLPHDQKSVTLHFYQHSKTEHYQIIKDVDVYDNTGTIYWEIDIIYPV